ncbi:tyrosine-type recombinase/integrase [Streptococcus gallolyticus]|uniref:tyrosine-type recombinase/integrase n=1 Tax=Streptococcus gallolyticus TaxID=315405 RepID=UPI000DA3E859|nr:site-specific integrase [Streptococcus gallolyticus]MCQ9215139.1 site-specific integrase [Streptococcus gallolyticus]SQI09225.1 Tn5276 integrase [Streptococcus pasteurianus]
MFYKELSNGKYRYYQKYWNIREEKWLQVSVTLKSKTRAVQAEAKRILEDKISKKNSFRSLQVETVKEVYEQWLVIRRMEVKPSTLRTQMGIMKEFIKVFGNEKLTKAKSPDLQKYLLAKDWSYGYRNLVRVYLSSFFAYAKAVGYLADNPMDNVVLPKHKVTREELELKRERYFSREQIRLYLNVLDEVGTNPIFNILVEFLYLTGLRIGEAQALMWSDINFETRILTVKHTVQRANKKSDYQITTPKTIHSYRKVYFNSRVVELLYELKCLTTVVSDKDLVFTDGCGDFFLMNTFNSYIQRYFDSEKLGKTDSFKLTSHVFRHSHVSLLAELGFHIREIMERVGHSDEKTTIQIYTHITEKMKQNSFEKLESVAI